MNDPHVVALHYNLKTNLLFDHPSPVDSIQSEFDIHLQDGKLTATMKTHYASLSEAQRAVDPFLRSWEIRAALDWQLHGHEWRFVFDQPKIIDRQPTPGTASIAVFGFVTATAKDVASVVITQPQYAPPPKDFIVAPDVETLWHRYEGHLLGREPLLSMAYFCLSFLEWRAGGGRQKVLSLYSIDEPVRKRLGDLISERGDERTARKADKKVTQLLALQAHEEEWVRAVIRQLIIRVGEMASDPTRSWPVITLTSI